MCYDHQRIAILIRSGSVQKPRVEVMRTAGVEIRVGDLTDDLEKLKAHLQGVDILISTAPAAIIEQQKNVFTAAKEVGVMQKNPALKILQFFKDAAGGTSSEAMGIPALDVMQARGAAPALGKESLPQLGAEDAERWLKYWKGIGFL